MSNTVRVAWSAAHTPVAGVPRWARIAAYAVPLTVLPSSLWRIAVVTLHLPIAPADHDSGTLPAWLPVELYVVLLSVVSELLAFTAIGLVARWGVVFPRWIPVLGGRRVPRLVAVVPAAVGAALLTVLWVGAAVVLSLGLTVDGRPIPADFPLVLPNWQGWLADAAYAPLVLWGPLLGALTFAYCKRAKTQG